MIVFICSEVQDRPLSVPVTRKWGADWDTLCSVADTGLHPVQGFCSQTKLTVSTFVWIGAFWLTIEWIPLHRHVNVNLAVLSALFRHWYLILWWILEYKCPEAKLNHTARRSPVWRPFVYRRHGSETDVIPVNLSLMPRVRSTSKVYSVFQVGTATCCPYPWYAV